VRILFDASRWYPCAERQYRLRRHGSPASDAGRQHPGGKDTMNEAARLRLFAIRHAFDEPGVVLILVLLGLGLAICPLVVLGLDRAGRLSPEL